MPRQLTCLATLFGLGFLAGPAQAAFTSLEPDLYAENSRIPDSGAYMRFWSANIGTFLRPDGTFADIFARNTFFGRPLYATAPSTGIIPSTGELVYSVSNNSGGSLWDGASAHVLFGDYLPAQNRFSFSPAKFISIDVIWTTDDAPSTRRSTPWVDVQLFADDGILLGSYRFERPDDAAFTRIAIATPGIARFAVIPNQSNPNRKSYGLDAFSFIASEAGIAYSLDQFGEIVVPAPVTLRAEDSLTGSGRVRGSVVNQGLISPGASIGTIEITDTFLQESGGRLLLELGQDGNDRLIVGGTAELGGTLELRLLGDFMPQAGSQFDLIGAASLLDRFDEILYPELREELRIVFSTVNDELAGKQWLRATIVPLPAAVWLFASSLLMLPVLRRRQSV